MHTLDLGSSLQVSALGMGCLPLTGAYGLSDENTSIRLLRHGLDHGVNLIDTADVYGGGRNEILVGRAIAGRREEVRIATKFGLRVGEPGVYASPDAVRPAVENSLWRLDVEQIDLLFLHRVDPTVPIEDTVGAMAELVQQGIVNHLGLSEVTADELRRAAAVHPIAAVQSEWSVWSRDVEHSVVPALTAVGAAFIASSPLGRGFLAGAADTLGNADERRRIPRLVGHARTANRAIADAVRDTARKLNATPAQVALAWLRQAAERSSVAVVPIPGTRSIEHLDENIDALDLVISQQAMDALDLLADRTVGGRGARPEWLSVGRELSPRER